MSYSPTLGRWTQTDPEQFVDGPNMYQMEQSSPNNHVDPLGLDSTTSSALAATGKGTWGTGDSAFDYEWNMTELSTYDKALRDSMGTGDSPGVTIVITVTKKPKCSYDKLLWIQYTEAQQDGKIYTPAPTKSDPRPNPWGGIDRYPNQNSRKDKNPYDFLPAEQDNVNAGKAFDGRFTGYKTGDVSFVDWASSGSATNWGQYSVVSLIGQKGGKNYLIGSLQWEYTLKDGKLTYGARPADADDMKTWNKALTDGNPDYKIEE